MKPQNLIQKLPAITEQNLGDPVRKPFSLSKMNGRIGVKES